MKIENTILKKTLFYRLIAIFWGIVISVMAIFLPRTVMWGFIVGGISEVVSLCIYYTFEFIWRKMLARKKIKQGDIITIVEDKHGWYNVISILDDNKFIIEVV